MREREFLSASATVAKLGVHLGLINKGNGFIVFALWKGGRCDGWY